MKVHLEKPTLFATVMLLLATMGSAAWAGAASRDDFGATVEVEQTLLKRSGVGVLKYLGFIRIYSGALYLPPDADADQALDDIPKRLEVRYLRSFKAEDIGAAAIAGMRRNTDPETFRELEPRIAHHNGLYEDLSSGDRVSLTYLPSVGTQVAINGRLKGTVGGADFARALFSLWLGDKPFDSDFKQSLLGASR